LDVTKRHRGRKSLCVHHGPLLQFEAWIGKHNGVPMQVASSG
jgi:hypothetical protein